MKAARFRALANDMGNGFTLLETMFVLGVVSIMLLLAVPLSWSLLEHQQEKQFLDTLQSDLLLIQSLSEQEEELIQIIFHEKDYLVQTSRTKEKTIRSFPPGWTFPPRSYTSISFKDGQIRKPGTIKFKINNEKEVKLVFPLGKGRGYIVE